ncbi:MAG: hypothetical protein ACLGIG_12515 [Actinomycetes bacterium]
MPRLAASLTAAALVLTACAGTDTSDTDDAAPSTPTRSADTGSPDPGGAVPEHDSARGAANAWLSAVADGRWDDAFSLLTPSSQDAVGGREELSEQASALREGWGTFAAADPTLHVVEVEPGAGAVTVQAEVTREGTTERAAEVLPYDVRDDGTVLRDVLARADGTARSDEVQDSATVVAGQAVTVVVPPAERGVLSLGSTPVESTETPEDGGLRLEGELPDTPPEGAWTALTAAWVDLDGRVGATAWRVTVEDSDSDAVALTQSCRNDVAGIDVRYPEGWTARQFGPDGGCAYFDPEPFEVPQDTEVSGIAVVLDVEHVPYERVRDGYLSNDVLERGDSELAGLPGDRLLVRRGQRPGPAGRPRRHATGLRPGGVRARRRGRRRVDGRVRRRPTSRGVWSSPGSVDTGCLRIMLPGRASRRDGTRT